MASMTPCADLALVYVHFLVFYVVKVHPVATLLGTPGWYRATLRELHFVLVLLISEEQFNLVSSTGNVYYFQSLLL